jgi:uncharacterized membrane protein
VTEPNRSWSDERLDQILGNLLRFGVLLAGAVVLLGGGVYLLRHAAEPVPSYREFRLTPEGYRHVSTIIAAAAAFRGRGIIQLGLLILIATPIARVVFSVFAFAAQRDYTYVTVTLIVLAVLVYSLLSGGKL